MELVPSEEQSFEVKWRKCMVEPSQPLGHAIIVGIFCFKGELLVPMQGLCDAGNRSRGETAIRSNLSNAGLPSAMSRSAGPLCNRFAGVWHARNQNVIKIRFDTTWDRSTVNLLAIYHGAFLKEVKESLSFEADRRGNSGIPKGTFQLRIEGVGRRFEKN
jgi:hypothetical protein